MAASKQHASLLDRRADAVASLHPDRVVRVAIDGVDGAGKTMLADALAPLIVAQGRPVIRASVDDFHNPREVRYARGKYSPSDTFWIPMITKRFERCCLIRWNLMDQAGTLQSILITGVTGWLKLRTTSVALGRADR